MFAGAAAIGSSWIAEDRVRNVLQAVMIALMTIYLMHPFYTVLVAEHCREECMYESTVLLFVLGIAVTVAGAVLFALRIPERLEEGKYDFLGASHQILHISIVISVGLFHFASARLWNSLAYQAADAMLRPRAVGNAETTRFADKAAVLKQYCVAECTHQNFTDRYGRLQQPDGSKVARDDVNNQGPVFPHVQNITNCPYADMVDDDRDY